MKAEREPSDTIRIYKTEKAKLMAAVSKRVEAWKKKKEGPKPWIADLVREWAKASR